MSQIIQEEYGVWIKNIIKPNFNFDMTMNLTNGEPDPDSLFYRRFSSDERQWPNGGDPEVDVLLDQGETTIDQAKRKEIYDKAQKLMVEKRPDHLDLLARPDRGRPERRQLRAALHEPVLRLPHRLAGLADHETAQASRHRREARTRLESYHAPLRPHPHVNPSSRRSSASPSPSSS